MSGEELATGCPPDILDLIPWYPDDGLSDAERGAVEAHAACCPACRRELHGAFGETDLPADAPAAERVLAQVFERIAERSRPEPDSASDRLPPPILAIPPSARAPRRPSWRRPLVAAAAALALAVLLAPRVLHLFAGSPAVYHTAAAPPVETQAAGPLLDVVLRGDVTASQLSTAFRSLGAEVVAGPTEMGRYRLRLPAEADASVAATALRAPETGVAIFAEPVR